ncbi:MAG TPA: copper resistance protein CopC [Candidatus Binataceae bacterium]|nr:copper resistance protein CopC [Candidatus Binataceae bacterium]
MAIRRLSITVALLLISTPACWAHSFPRHENPSAGQRLSAAPAQVSILYDAPVEKLFATLKVLDANGHNWASGPPTVSPDGYTLSVKLPPLKPGKYTVKWACVCVDTHHTEGSYNFTVAATR